MSSLQERTTPVMDMTVGGIADRRGLAVVNKPSGGAYIVDVFGVSRYGMTCGLAVESVREDDDRSIVVLQHRPGFRLRGDGESVVMTHHPHLEMPGRPPWRLPNVISVINEKQ